VIMKNLCIKIQTELKEVSDILETFDDVKDTEQRTVQLYVAELCVMSAMEGLRKMKMLHEGSQYEIAPGPPPMPSPPSHYVQSYPPPEIEQPTEETS